MISVEQAAMLSRQSFGSKEQTGNVYSHLAARRPQRGASRAHLHDAFEVAERPGDAATAREKRTLRRSRGQTRGLTAPPFERARPSLKLIPPIGSDFNRRLLLEERLRRMAEGSKARSKKVVQRTQSAPRIRRSKRDDDERRRKILLRKKESELAFRKEASMRLKRVLESAKERRVAVLLRGVAWSRRIESMRSLREGMDAEESFAVRDEDRGLWILLCAGALLCAEIMNVLVGSALQSHSALRPNFSLGMCTSRSVTDDSAISRRVADLQALGVPAAELRELVDNSSNAVLDNDSSFSCGEGPIVPLRVRQEKVSALSKLIEAKLARVETPPEWSTWMLYNVTFLCVLFYCRLKYRAKRRRRCAEMIRLFFLSVKPGSRIRDTIHKFLSRVRLIQRSVKSWIAQRFERHREISTRWMRMELGIIRERWMAEQAAKIAELEARLSKMAAMGQQVDVLEMKQLEKSREAYKCIVRPPRYLQSLRKRKLREIAAQHREDIERFKMDLKTWRDVYDAVRMISPHQDAHLPTPVCPPVPHPISTVPDGVIEQVIRRLQDEVGGSDVVGEAKRRRFCEDSRSAEEERKADWLWKDAKQSPSGRYVDLHPALDR
ncbi:hypothetical protein FOZ60_007795 [Perkinsus olseni]|uniref:Uncharacterized protein n=1 Tax=Perkinsus olseni TaxID=32597 RepID=A0A7J6PGE2_PEROL|nr:hypothetical protein FOZ60_007795 [Perkinsus olseni]